MLPGEFMLSIGRRSRTLANDVPSLPTSVLPTSLESFYMTSSDTIVMER